MCFYVVSLVGFGRQINRKCLKIVYSINFLKGLRVPSQSDYQAKNCWLGTFKYDKLKTGVVFYHDIVLNLMKFLLSLIHASDRSHLMHKLVRRQVCKLNMLSDIVVDAPVFSALPAVWVTSIWKLLLISLIDIHPLCRVCLDMPLGPCFALIITEFHFF